MHLQKVKFLEVVNLSLHSSEGGIIPPPFAYPPFFQNCAIPPEKQYIFLKNFAFHSSVDTVENVTVKKILISV